MRVVGDERWGVLRRKLRRMNTESLNDYKILSIKVVIFVICTNVYFIKIIFLKDVIHWSIY